MESLNLVDIWRLSHPIDRDYSFFFPVHKAYSQIDYFLLDSKLLSIADKIMYHPILVSDHAPISMRPKLVEQISKKAHWRFDAMLLKDTKFKMYLDKHISHFITENDNGVGQ